MNARVGRVHTPVPLGFALTRLVGLLLRDVVLTRDEVDGLVAGLLTSAGPTQTRLDRAAGPTITGRFLTRGMSPNYGAITGGKRQPAKGTDAGGSYFLQSKRGPIETCQPKLRPTRDRCRRGRVSGNVSEFDR